MLTWMDLPSEQVFIDAYKAALAAKEKYFFVTCPTPTQDTRGKLFHRPDVWATVTNPSQYHRTFGRSEDPRNAARPNAILKISVEKFGAWYDAKLAREEYAALQRRLITDEECVEQLRKHGAVRVTSPDDPAFSGWYYGGSVCLSDVTLRETAFKLLKLNGCVVTQADGSLLYETGGWPWHAPEDPDDE